MNSSKLTKLFEFSIVPSLKKSNINSLQFGFTAGWSSDNAVTLSKETLHDKANIYFASINLSEAFDKINVKILIDKLNDIRLPIPIIRIISYILYNNYANVAFDNCFWGWVNGVRQGGNIIVASFFHINECIEEISLMIIMKL